MFILDLELSPTISFFSEKNLKLSLIFLFFISSIKFFAMNFILLFFKKYFLICSYVNSLGSIPKVKLLKRLQLTNLLKSAILKFSSLI